MSIYDVGVFILVVVLVAALGVTAGCLGDKQQDLSYLPCCEMDYSAARPAVGRDFSRPDTRGDVKTSVTPDSAKSTSNHKWAAVGNRPWKYIVIHHSASEYGNASVFHKQHLKRGWDELGYHFVINNGRGGTNGKVQMGSRWRKQKWGAHCGKTPNNEYNNFGIGICLVGNFMNRMPSKAQMQSMEELVGYLMETYDIPARNVIAHKDAPNAQTECCGRVLYRHMQSQAFQSKLRSNFFAAAVK